MGVKTLIADKRGCEYRGITVPYWFSFQPHFQDILNKNQIMQNGTFIILQMKSMLSTLVDRPTQRPLHSSYSICTHHVIWLSYVPQCLKALRQMPDWCPTPTFSSSLSTWRK